MLNTDNPCILVAGHRGTGCTDSPHAEKLGKGRLRVPESTLLAIENGLRGANLVEFDTIPTKDNHIVITHSTDFSQHVPSQFRPRGKTYIDELTLTEVSQLRLELGGYYQIPRLRQALKLARDIRPGNDLIFNIELKGVQGTNCPRREPSLAELVVNEIRQEKFSLGRIRFSSFSLDMLADMHARAPDAQLGMLFNEALPPGTLPGKIFADGDETYLSFTIAKMKRVFNRIPTLTAVHPEIQTLTEETSVFATNSGLAIATWGWEEESPLGSPVFGSAAYKAITLSMNHNVPLILITDYIRDMNDMVETMALSRNRYPSLASVVDYIKNKRAMEERGTITSFGEIARRMGLGIPTADF
jgi:glycerophosphoryl diester phosphodiesterase